MKGFIAEPDGLTYYTDGQDVFRAPEGNAVEARTGDLIGRWECSVVHWNHFCRVVYGLPPVERRTPEQPSWRQTPVGHRAQAADWPHWVRRDTARSQ